MGAQNQGVPSEQSVTPQLKIFLTAESAGSTRRLSIGLVCGMVGGAMYESRKNEPLNSSAFAFRLGWHFAIAAGLLGASLALGMAGYAYFEGLSAVDGFLNAAMLLGGMGPVNAPLTAAGKLFAGAYALYAGLVFIVSAALVFTPIVHRVLHKFHWDSE